VPSTFGGGRPARPLVTLDAAAIPDGLAESQLFGHARGAFTGAVESREGVFALAHTGTLFIDEIGELGLALQSKLLRVLQFSEFTQVGSGHRRRVDVRVITATNRDLRRAVKGGTFRSDLYHRIGVIHIVIPPLRERRDDIPLLAHHFVERFARAYGRATRRLSPRTLDLFAHHDWPGNVRELENCIEQAVIFGGGDVLEVHDVRNALAHPPVSEALGTPAPGEPFRGRTLRELEQWYITATLERFGGNRTRTARSIGLSLRGLQYRLKAYESRLTTEVAPPARIAPRQLYVSSRTRVP
jgi:transcriptional regulator with GAF, ATPase, and Fis domain